MKLVHTLMDEFSFKKAKEDAIVDFLKREFDIDAEYDYRGFLVYKGTFDRITNMTLRNIKSPNHKKLLGEAIGEFINNLKIDKKDYITVAEYDVLKIFLSESGNAVFVCADDEGKVKTFNSQQDIKIIREANDNKNIE